MNYSFCKLCTHSERGMQFSGRHSREQPVHGENISFVNNKSKFLAFSSFFITGLIRNVFVPLEEFCSLVINPSFTSFDTILEHLLLSILAAFQSSFWRIPFFLVFINFRIFSSISILFLYFSIGLSMIILFPLKMTEPRERDFTPSAIS